MYLLDGMKAPSFATFGKLIRQELTDSVEEIFVDVNTYIFEKEQVDLDHTYIDGTKIEANANRYTWVWKKSCTNNRGKVFEKISALIDAMNHEVLGYLSLKLEKREAYAIEYVSERLEMYKKGTNLDESTFVSGCCSGRRDIWYFKMEKILQKIISAGREKRNSRAHIGFLWI